MTVTLIYVVYCSLVIDALSARGQDEVLRQRLSAPRTLHAPHHLDVEIASTLPRCAGPRSGFLRLGLLRGHVTLRGGLVLLGCAFLLQRLVPAYGPGRFLGQALHVFHDACLRSRFVRQEARYPCPRAHTQRVSGSQCVGPRPQRCDPAETSPAGPGAPEGAHSRSRIFLRITRPAGRLTPALSDQEI
jgi:hypothetical protein